MPRKKKSEEVTESLIRVQAVVKFNDLEAHDVRHVGDIWEVGEERYKVLSGENHLHTQFVKKL